MPSVRATSRPQPTLAPPPVDQAPRCWRCGRKLAEHVGRPWKLVCHKCKARNASQACPAE